MRVYLAIILIISTSEAIAADYLCNNVGRNWTWFSDHIAVSVNYIAIGSVGRKYEIGTGISIAGSPRGWKATYSGEAKFSSWGIGAVHIRQADDGLPFKVCVTSGSINPITIYKQEF